MARAWLIVVIAAACGPSSAEVKTARQTTYNADPGELMERAMQATVGAHYRIAQVDREHHVFTTVSRAFSKEGDLESPGAEGYTQIRAAA